MLFYFFFSPFLLNFLKVVCPVPTEASADTYADTYGDQDFDRSTYDDGSFAVHYTTGRASADFGGRPVSVHELRRSRPHASVHSLAGIPARV